MRDKKIQVHADIIVDKARARRQSGACQTRLRCYALKDSAAGDSGANFRVLLQNASTLSSRTIDSYQFWRNFSREGRLSLFSTSPYAASTAFHTCRTSAPGPVISDVSNCPFLILFANSIPLNVTCAFPNVLIPSIG